MRCPGEETGTAGKRRSRNSGQATRRPHCRSPSWGRSGTASALPLTPDQLCNHHRASTLLSGSVAPTPPFRLAKPQRPPAQHPPFGGPGPLQEQCDSRPVGCPLYAQPDSTGPPPGCMPLDTPRPCTQGAGNSILRVSASAKRLLTTEAQPILAQTSERVAHVGAATLVLPRPWCGAAHASRASPTSTARVGGRRMPGQ